MKSIHARLLWWLFLASCVALALAALIVYSTAHKEANEIFDRHLRQIALTLRDQPFEDVDIEGTLEEEAEYDFTIQVWDEHRAKLYSSHTEADLPQQAKPGFSTVIQGGGTWRVFLLAQDGLNIQVSQPLMARQRRAARLALSTVAPFMILLPLMGLLIWLTVSKGLAPLDSLAKALRQRDHTSLEPVPDGNLPVELQPLVNELNDLLRRLGHAIEAQRAFTADAAHELRTPLTALQLQAQLAERAVDPMARKIAFERLRAGLRRSIHLVQQLLTLARNEPDVPSRDDQLVDLSALVQDIALEYVGIAGDKKVDLGIVRADAVQVQGNPDGLRALVGNLVQNAVRYTPPGGKVDLSVIDAEPGAILEICDNGPGIPLDERERVFDRFHRGVGETLQQADDQFSIGSGIGLAIVKNVATRHGAQVTLSDPPQGSGLVARVQFPRPAKVEAT